MSSTPPIQLGLLPGFDAPALPSAPVEPVHEAPPRRAVSAERAMLAAQTSLLRVDTARPDAPVLRVAEVDPQIEGWREQMLRPEPRPAIVDGACSLFEKWRRLEDGSIGPCGSATCPRNLLLDVGEPITIGKRRHAELLLNRAGAHPSGADPVMGRRPALPAVPTDDDIDEFDTDALARLDELPDTCQVDVMRRLAGLSIDDGERPGESPAERRERLAAEHARIDAARVGAIADVLGVSEEQVRLDTLSAFAKLGLIGDNGAPMPGDPSIVERILAALSPRRPRIRRTWRGKVGKPPPAPRAITRKVRRTWRGKVREAPPPREPTAGEIFTF